MSEEINVEGIDEQLSNKLFIYSTNSNENWILDEYQTVQNGEPTYSIKTTEKGKVAALLQEYCEGLLAGRHIRESGTSHAFKDLMRWLGTPAQKTIVDLTRDTSMYDPSTQYMYDAAGTVDPYLTPQKHDEVYEWLRLMGGSQEERRKKFGDWLGTFLRLDRPTCAIYICGKKGIGKGMLASGLARIFDSTAQPVSWQKAMSQFNDPLRDRPIAYIDEKAPPSSWGEKAPEDQIRNFIGQTSIEVEGKGDDQIPMNGCPRLLITANHAHAIDFGNALNEASQSAIQDRIGFIEVGSEPREYLEEIGGADKTYGENWTERIAETVLWMNEDRDVKPDPRFLVTGWPSKLSMGLAGGGLGKVLTDVLIQYIKHASPEFDEQPGMNEGVNQVHWEVPFGDIRENGLLSSRTLSSGVYMRAKLDGIESLWEMYADDPPTGGTLADLVKSFSTHDASKTISFKRHNGETERKRGYELKVGKIINAAPDLGTDPYKLMDALKIPTGSDLREVIQKTLDDEPPTDRKPTDY